MRISIFVDSDAVFKNYFHGTDPVYLGKEKTEEALQCPHPQPAGFNCDSLALIERPFSLLCALLQISGLKISLPSLEHESNLKHSYKKKKTKTII